MPAFGDSVAIDRVTCTKATDHALLCVIDGVEHWIPRSQVFDESDVLEEGDTGSLVITEWIAQQKGL